MMYPLLFLFLFSFNGNIESQLDNSLFVLCIIYLYRDSLVSKMAKSLCAMQETHIQFLGW